MTILFDSDCTRLKALKAWKNVFKYSFWDDRIKEEESEIKNSTVAIPIVAATKPWLMMQFTDKSLNEIKQYFPKIKLANGGMREESKTKNSTATISILATTKSWLMMQFTDKNLDEIKQYFPKLELANGEIRGGIEVAAKYIQNKRGKWMIESCNLSNDSDCVSGKYQIRIILNQTGMFEVYETEGKIARLAKQLNISDHDLHINSDGSCCLGFFINPKLTIKEFILNKVYPFFVWQAYYEKLEVSPPSGEYSHGDKAVSEFISDMKKMTRNDICFCGSGKKYKKCCMNLL